MTENKCYCPLAEFKEGDERCKKCGGILREEQKTIIAKKNKKV